MIRQLSTFATLALAFLATACIPAVKESLTSTPAYPKPDGSRKVLQERRTDAPEIDADVDGNNIDVKVYQQTECRKVQVTPMVQDQTTERTLNGGSSSYWINGGTAALLAGVGAALAFSSCTDTPQGTTSNPNPSSTPCTQSEASAQRTGGYVTMALAVVPIGFIVYNAVHSTNSTTTVPAPPSTEPRPWTECADTPLTNEQISVAVGGTTLQGRTGADGHALIDFSGLEPTTSLAAAPYAIVQHRGSKDVTVSLKGSSAFASWKERLDAEARERQAALERASAEQLRQHEALKNLVSHLDRWARAAIKVQRATTNHSETHCFNMVDFEVPCTSAGAFRKQETFSVTNQATVTNAGRLALVCAQSGDLFGNGKTTVRIPPSRTVVLPAVESGGLELLLAAFGGAANSVICGLPAASVSSAIGLDVSPVVAPESNLIVGIVGTDSYVFMSSEKDRKTLYMWDGIDVIVK